MENEYQDNEKIEEGTGGLPAWWVWIIYAGFAFGLVYAVWMHGFLGWTQEGEYKDAVAAHAKLAPKTVAKLTAEGVNPLRNDATAIDKGRKTYMGFCGACHKPDMTGLVGPSLADKTWLHGTTDKQIYTVIMKGVQGTAVMQSPPKGPMPAHEKSLGPQKVLEVMAYISSQNKSLVEK